MSVKIQWFKPAIQNLLYDPDGTVGRYLKHDIGDAIIDLAKIQVGYRTGRLQESIAHKRHFKDPRGQQMWIGSSVRYALVHHEGRGPQVIVPKKGKVLRFVSKGQVIFARKVMDKGAKPNRYLSDPMSKVIK
jgi:hypothetical protein